MSDDDAGQGDVYHARMEAPVDFVPQRVVSLVPSITESFFDLDLGSRLIAVTSDCIRPADSVEYLLRVGGTKSPDIARIIALRPDLVLMHDEENRREDGDVLRAADIPVWVTESRTVFDALNLLWAIMDVFDHPVMVPRVREIERAYDYSLGASRASVPTSVFLPVWRDPWMTVSASSFAFDMLRVCGGLSVGSDAQREQAVSGAAGPDTGIPEVLQGGRYQPITLADVLAAQPEVVLLPDEPYSFSEIDQAEIAALDIPAAHTGRIHLIDGSLLTWHGTRMAYALRDLPVLLS